MMGSETFIMVALKWADRSTPSRLAASIPSSKNRRRAFLLITAASITSPSRRGSLSFRISVLPSSPTSSMRTVSADAMVTDFSEPKKSPSFMESTRVLESGLQAPMVCGFLRANSFTAAAERRSELPSRSTGLTALPSTLE